MPEKPQEPEGSDAQDSGAPKFKFECTRCGECCKTETVPVYICDLERWVTDQTIFRVLHVLDLEITGDSARLFLKKDEDGYCKLYHRDNKACTIQDNKPLFCKSYPLGYNGTNYVLRSKDCPGLKAESMDKELLTEMRDLAFEDFIAERQVTNVMPILQSIFYNKLIEESQKAMDKVQDTQDDDIEVTEE
ncbi:MAG: YkgJ family cysteine cluster protein [Thermoplasmata archaeon]|nr:YkgJ family cysteine cluster protein [Thermoplasmata archaeon]